MDRTSVYAPELARPAQEIAQQYEQRRRIQTSYRELNQEMLGAKLKLRSGSPQTVRQEVWGVLLAYNLVRLEMVELAREEGVVPTELSFTVALHYLCDEWHWLANISPSTCGVYVSVLGDLLLPKKDRGVNAPVW